MITPSWFAFLLSFQVKISYNYRMRWLYPFLLFLLTTLPFIAAEITSKRTPGYRVDVDTVVVRVAVTDPLNRYVVGLDKEHFRIYEDKIEQDISHFSNDKSPVSVGVIFDVSGSMGDNVFSARNSVGRFLKKGDPGDEYFLVTFNDNARLVQDFTPRDENIQTEVSISNPKGRTALYDAVYLGLEKIQGARHDKKALIIITDGEDNSSRYSFTEVRDFAKESDVQIYVIGERGEIGFGRGIITEIVKLTGGRAFFPNSFKQLDYFCDLIHTELRNQYLLSYISSNRNFNGKWRKIKVRLDAPEGLPKLKVRSRKGYFVPQKQKR